MATYVMGDVHGMYTRFLEMLHTIQFKDSDRLIMIGDVIDRGPNGLDVLERVMNAPNIEMVMGNHELMMLDYLSAQTPKEAIHDRSIWFHNGGKPTFDALMKLSEEEHEHIRGYLLNLPISMEIEVGKQKYYLVHGFPEDDAYDALWSRPNKHSRNPLEDPSVRVIVGHTATCYLHGTTDEDAFNYLNELADRNEHLMIEKLPGFIDIDCGSGHQKICPQVRLACLRLDDMAEFYV